MREAETGRLDDTVLELVNKKVQAVEDAACVSKEAAAEEEAQGDVREDEAKEEQGAEEDDGKASCARGLMFDFDELDMLEDAAPVERVAPLQEDTRNAAEVALLSCDGMGQMGAVEKVLATSSPLLACPKDLVSDASGLSDGQRVPLLSQSSLECSREPPPDGPEEEQNTEENDSKANCARGVMFDFDELDMLEEAAWVERVAPLLEDTQNQRVSPLEASQSTLECSRVLPLDEPEHEQGIEEEDMKARCTRGMMFDFDDLDMLEEAARAERVVPEQEDTRNASG